MGLNIQDLEISSPAFDAGGRIPTRHARDGDDVSPELRWSGVPDGTAQLAVVCHDPDAPLPHGFTHWVVYGIPADASGIEEGGGGRYTEGENDFGEQGYGGPMPPEGHGTHHYYFWVYALDTEVDAAPGLTREDLLDRIGDHIIEQNRVVGTYEL
jgi:Raf kinase inhibitor-like YbhB/YbcL family protein